MTLRLSVVSEHGIRLGAHSTKVFGVHGGSIGRGSDNEWILPDPERYLSGKHARVDFRAGTYVLVDTSSNGTYINGSQIPLGKFHDYSLKDGDYVRLGEYELLVSIDKATDFPPEQGAIVAYDGHAPSSSVRKATANDLGENLDLIDLLEPSDRLAIESGPGPRNAYGQAVAPERAPAAAAAAAKDSDTPWHMMTRPLNVPGKVHALPSAPAASKLALSSAPAATPSSGSGGSSAQPARAPATALFEGDVEGGLAAFCRGAGVDPRAVPAEVRAAVLQQAGQLLRESVLGLMDLNQSRAEFRNRFRIPAPADDGPESPLNFSGGVEEAMVRLLTRLSTRAGSVEAIRDNFRELKAQNTASYVALHAAFEEFLGRVDPKQLEERFERSAKRGVFGLQNKAKYWELYTEMFAGLAHRPADGFPHLFMETFAKAFADKLRKLVPPRRRLGADRGESPDADDRAVGEP